MTAPGPTTQPAPPPLPADQTPAGYGYAYGQPGPGGGYPAPPARGRWRVWLGVVTGFVVLAVVIAGVSAYILNRNKQKTWVLSAPPSVAGMSRDARAIDQAEFSALVAKFRSDVTSLPNYGRLRSTVSGVYRLGPDQAVGFVGFNGTFNVQVVLKTGPGLKVSRARPGSHGGTAECGSTSSDVVCQWSTGTTVGIVLVIPTGFTSSRESLESANDLMVRIRGSVERPAPAS